MSQVRVHNFSISLDGFGTGEGLTFDAPFGHAGQDALDECIAFGLAPREPGVIVEPKGLRKPAEALANCACTTASSKPSGCFSSRL